MINNFRISSAKVPKFSEIDPDFEADDLDHDSSGPEAADLTDDGDWAEVAKPKMIRLKSKPRTKKQLTDQEEKRKKRIGSKIFASLASYSVKNVSPRIDLACEADSLKNNDCKYRL